MKTVTVHHAKTNLSRLIQEAENGEQITIARGAHPVVQLVPLAGAKGKRQPGSLKGKLRVDQEFFEPLPASELRAWE
jgi:PIN domain nuclease of toxin-antitoxin system/antitoxin (DNA-binding transcriptional repressor) of toxin-antitoxin stability system